MPRTLRDKLKNKIEARKFVNDKNNLTPAILFGDRINKLICIITFESHKLRDIYIDYHKLNQSNYIWAKGDYVNIPGVCTLAVPETRDFDIINSFLGYTHDRFFRMTSQPSNDLMTRMPDMYLYDITKKRVLYNWKVVV